MNYAIYHTPFKVVLGYIWSDKGLREMGFYPDEESFKNYLKKFSEDFTWSRLVDLEEAIDKYFNGESISLDYNLDISGTRFQKKVWSIVKEIPYGEVRSYKWIASRVGNPKAARPVGNAVASNPVVLIIPCHRVIRSNGSIGRYGDLDWLKVKLLRLEKVRGVDEDIRDGEYC
ncbi:MAG: methylated-DNA--[protein]-cysteine S-methyltransferase [Candidatus Caldarchaeales archaeon]